ncbi:cyclopropane-fatty-acyl-phospholipid synthase [Agaricicola taiwanensis]|uniref:Cyclopropane-fatty-acyl-phospholipid synthase n=1 Tax=Agaricicola taiwanensis TaxID=591372 RepID=A0A8J2VIT6_9RHOB|nr:cyclopropane-fatty-acyl-phospholipid synthase family protein [Agaricicola taiwanensis]GGE27543.1 cyclopropane-fatty-acyl-phospholipid synthase [Agaricicola taiwanensis]
MTDSSLQASALAALLTEVCAKIAPRLVFQLWDGRRIPYDAPADEPAIAIRDAGAVSRLLRRPKLDTFLRLYLAGRIDFINGDLFDIAERRPEGKPGRLVRTLKRGVVLRALRAFAFHPGGPELLGMEARSGKAGTGGAADKNRANIAHHYDVSNAFYRLFLDERMVYTCGYFDGWHDDLGKAQEDKLEMICRKLRLQPGERMLDIGCGWGALLIHAAERYDIRGVGVTLSEEQALLARELVSAKGLQDKIEIRLADYASLDESFDKISSIGMFEHVGIDNHAAYFSAVHRLLKPRGLYLHHAITRRAKASDNAFRRKRPEYEALTKFIFPGGELDHIGMSLKNLERHGFEVHDVEGWREHYARTTRLWAKRLSARRAEAEREAGEVIARAWLIYLAGVSLAFERGGACIFQTVASRRTRSSSGLPATRRDLYR